jgi:hypothetical protein
MALTTITIGQIMLEWKTICEESGIEPAPLDYNPKTDRIYVPLNEVDKSVEDDILIKYYDRLQPMITKFENQDDFKIKQLVNIWSDIERTGKPEIRLRKAGDKFVIDNEDEILNYVDANEEVLEHEYDQFMDQLDIYNASIEFDIILGIFMHGRYATECAQEVHASAEMLGELMELDSKGKPKIATRGPCRTIDLEQGMQTTFLQATLCGISNIEGPEIRELIKEYLHPMIYAKTIDLQTLQQKLKNEKKRDLKTGPFHKQLDRYGHAIASAFRGHDGWNILTNGYLDREYQIDPEFGNPPLTVFYSKLDIMTPANIRLLDDLILFLGQTHMNLKKSNVIIRRSELINYLHSLGYRHPLIIDVSCGDISTSARRARRIAYEQRKQGRAGGKRKPKNKTSKKNKKHSRRPNHVRKVRTQNKSGYSSRYF